MEGLPNNYTISDESRAFLNQFADEHFGPSFNMEDFLEIIRNQPRKLFTDALIFMIHPNVNKYAGRFIKSNKLDECIKKRKQRDKDELKTMSKIKKTKAERKRRGK